MHLEPDGEAVRGRARQPGPGAQFREPARIFGHGLQHGHGLVQNADTALLVSRAMLSHDAILASRDLGSPESGKIEPEVADVPATVPGFLCSQSTSWEEHR
ncbi:hypothetical protein GCM10017786_55230 [Amycolatopsis deserti]|uniref:Uncharacterized protein n=1 Tax=Amycolatopsis deserti TaxID=185696 RepID=A0ABQ3JDY8_9PSEU|nr:hypothetical protein GCM10017786_55230 [Amycolatopsis deserti]